MTDCLKFAMKIHAFDRPFVYQKEFLDLVQTQSHVCDGHWGGYSRIRKRIASKEKNPHWLTCDIYDRYWRDIYGETELILMKNAPARLYWKRFLQAALF